MKAKIFTRVDSIFKRNSPVRMSLTTRSTFVTCRAFPGQIVKFKVADCRILPERIT